MKEKNNDLATGQLEERLGHTHAKEAEIRNYLKENSGRYAQGEKAFGWYMKDLFHQKKMKINEVCELAGISSKYGYKILGSEKHPQKRDLVISLCIAGRFTLEQTQRALKLYGAAPLYAKVNRDAVLIIALNENVRNIWEVDEMLQKYGFDALEKTNSEKE